MAFDFEKLAAQQYVSDTTGAIVTAAEKTYVRAIILHNQSAADAEVQLFQVPNSTGSVGTATATHQFFRVTVASYETVIIELPNPGMILEEVNDTIQGVCDTASAVTISVDGGTE